jgi:hypothetical protein
MRPTGPAGRHTPDGVWLTLSLISVAGMAGIVAGLGVAAFGLTLIGQPLLDLPPERLQLILVVAPLAGLLPVAVLAYVAAQRRDVAQAMPATLGLWLAMTAITIIWFGLRPLLG